MLIFPTSYDGTLSNFGKIVIYGYSYTLLFIFGKVDKIRLFLSTFLLLLILIFTMISSGRIFAGNQFITMLALLIILSINSSQIIISRKTMDIFTLILLYILIVCGYLLAYDTTFLINFFIKFYTFGYEKLAITMYAMGKPVMFFIAHSIAALSLSFLFIMTHLWGTTSSNLHIVLLSYLLIPLVVMQQSFTSYFMLAVIFIYLLFSGSKRSKQLVLFLTIIVVIYFLPTILDFDLSYLMGNSNNGIESRYGNDGVYSKVINDIKSSPFIGKGLLLELYQYKADSGVMNELLRGGVIYFIVMKVLIFSAIFNVTKQIKTSVYFTLLLIFSDFAYSFTYSLRGPLLIFLLLIFLNNIRILNINKSVGKSL
jgi:hypothetical protein